MDTEEGLKDSGSQGLKAPAAKLERVTIVSRKRCGCTVRGLVSFVGFGV